jgi:DsbC/DsbD-like thiol-disulfide interchange protein
MTPKLPAPLARVLPLAFGMLALMLLPAASRAQDASDWSKGPSSAARLVSGGGLQADGAYRPGIEIKLVGDALTYWRTPGESGVPPVATFAGSQNLSSADLRFPAPQRLQEGGSEVYGYREHVFFPLRVVPQDPTKPVRLALELHYAACDKICVPAEARAQVTLAPNEPPTAFATALSEADAKVPRLDGPGAPRLDVTRRDPLTWVIAVDSAASDGDLFAEAADGWFFETHHRAYGFDLVLAERPAEGDEVPVTFTVVTPNGAWERSMKLDVKGATP